jgi:sodium/hydrogen antiporter
VTALFISGLKLRLPPTHHAWAAVYRLAGPVMLLCIAGVAAFGHWILGLSPPLALLLGAVLAPTDPVLAGSVSVSDAADRDRLKYALSGEAGLNDGTAFPFVVLALAWKGHTISDAGSIARWVLLDLLWAVGAALIAGYLLGLTLGKLSIMQRSQQRDTEAPSDLAALALIALSYTVGHLLHSWAFLAVFAAGVGLRRAELGIVAATPHPEISRPQVSHPPAEHLVSAKVNPEELEAPAIAAGVLVAETMSFGTTVERILEVVLVTLVGAAVGSYWDYRALPIAFFLFFVLRPLGVYVLLLGTKTSALQRWLIGWFGIRGIGSLYYLAYAQNSLSKHGDVAGTLAGLTLSVISLSILIHGTSATPLLALYERRVRAASARSGRGRRR